MTDPPPRREGRDSPSTGAAQPDRAAPGREPARTSDAVIGLVATFARLGTGLGRTALAPARMLGRSVGVEPIVRSRVDALAATGRDATARGGRHLEDAADRILAAPGTVRTIDRALEGPIPAALNDEAVDRIVARLVETGALERIVRDVATSSTTRELVDEVVRSAELQRALEEVLSGPAVRNAIGREARTLGEEVAAAVRRAAGRVDARIERLAHRLVRRRDTAVANGAGAYAGIVSRGAAFGVDLALTQLGALVVGALAGLVGTLFGVSSPGAVVAALVGAGWAVVVGGYFVLFWSAAGQTPGMRALGLRLVDASGQRPRAGRALLRLVVAVVALAPLALGYLPVLVDRRRRALHDLVARTAVVRDHDGARLAALPRALPLSDVEAVEGAHDAPGRPKLPGDSSAASTS